MIDLISVCLNNSLLKSTGHCFRTLHIFTLQFSDKKNRVFYLNFSYYYLLSLRLNHIKLAGVTAETSSSAHDQIWEQWSNREHSTLSKYVLLYRSTVSSCFKLLTSFSILFPPPKLYKTCYRLKFLLYSKYFLWFRNSNMNINNQKLCKTFLFPWIS